MAAADRRLPLFPLSEVVLFPGTRVPLHIFERRYRQMMAQALEGDRLLGMVTVVPDEDHDLRNDPPVFQVGCAGFVTDFEELADGRYDLVLQGTQRFRILREEPPEGERLYRIAEVELLDESEETEAFDERREEVMRLLHQLARDGTQRDDLETSAARLATLDHAGFVNALCLAIGLPAVEKQGLLEANGISQRLERLDGLLRFHLAAVGGGAMPERPVVH